MFAFFMFLNTLMLSFIDKMTNWTQSLAVVHNHKTYSCDVIIIFKQYKIY